MDETLADSLKEQIRRYNSEFAEKIAADDLHGNHLEDAQQLIRELAREHEVFIVSAAMEIPESFAAKYRWLRTEAQAVRGIHPEDNRFSRRRCSDCSAASLTKNPIFG